MSQETLNIAQAEEAMNNWIINNYPTPKIDDIKFKIIRTDLVKQYKEIKAQVNNIPSSRKLYNLDVEFGIFIYSYLTQDWFTLRIAENDDFWRFLSVKIIPDIVADRWDVKQIEHFYSRGTRIWLKSLWWYVFLSWQGNITDTKNLLLNNNMNTDTIQNLVERSGRHGVYVEVYRKIMKYYSLITPEKLKELEKSIKETKIRDTFFRNVMKLNTAKMMLVEPGLYENEETGYVKSLFEELGVNINEA